MLTCINQREVNYCDQHVTCINMLSGVSDLFYVKDMLPTSTNLFQIKDKPTNAINLFIDMRQRDMCAQHVHWYKTCWLAPSTRAVQMDRTWWDWSVDIPDGLGRQNLQINYCPVNLKYNFKNLLINQLEILGWLNLSTGQHKNLGQLD